MARLEGVVLVRLTVRFGRRPVRVLPKEGGSWTARARTAGAAHIHECVTGPRRRTASIQRFLHSQSFFFFFF